LANASILSRSRGASEGDAFYCCVPLFNSGGWSLNIFSALASGLPIGVDTSFSVTEFWDRCRLYGATHILTLGTMHIFLWQAPPRDDDADNPVRLGGCVPLPHEIVGPFKERFGIETIWQGFGQSEMMGWTLCDTTRQDWKPNSCGIVRSDLEVKLFDEDDREVPVGEVGEVCVRPKEPEVMFAGYFGRPEVTLAAYRNLWYHSGDLARFDEDGEMFFVDRKTDYMRFAGRNISSFDVENTLLGHPAVKEVAAHGIPVPDMESESELMVSVVLAPGATATHEELARYVNDNAPYYLVPRYIELVDELPYTPTGRVQKYLLRDRGVTPATWDRVEQGFEVIR
jgi:crotonobetaine/carnitine-CoA ligase